MHFFRNGKLKLFQKHTTRLHYEALVTSLNCMGWELYKKKLKIANFKYISYYSHWTPRSLEQELLYFTSLNRIPYLNFRSSWCGLNFFIVYILFSFTSPSSAIVVALDEDERRRRTERRLFFDEEDDPGAEWSSVLFLALPTTTPSLLKWSADWRLESSSSSFQRILLLKAWI